MEQIPIKLIIDCQCGSFFDIKYRNKHLTTKKHLNYLEQNNLTNNDITMTLFSLFEPNEDINDLGFLHIKDIKS